MIILERPIKTLGVFDVKVVLHPEVSVTITVNVARSDDEAELQKDGVNVIEQMFEDEQAERRSAKPSKWPKPAKLPLTKPTKPMPRASKS